MIVAVLRTDDLRRDTEALVVGLRFAITEKTSGGNAQRSG
jgi:hypothetical protein